MFKGLIGKKIGMTQIFDEKGVAIPVTLIEAGPCYVTQVRTPELDGYSAVQLGFDEVKPKRLTGGQKGHLKRNSLPPLRYLREFRAKDPQLEEGSQVKSGPVCHRRARRRDRYQQRPRLRGWRQTLSLQGWPENSWSVRSRARARFARFGYNPGSCFQGCAWTRSYGR